MAWKIGQRVGRRGGFAVKAVGEASGEQPGEAGHDLGFELVGLAGEAVSIDHTGHRLCGIQQLG
jgi:hypothetical protein